MSVDKGATLSTYVKYIVGAVCHEHAPIINAFVDNTSALTLATNFVQPKRNLHVHARFFYVRDLVMGKHYFMHHLGTDKQLADLMCSYKGVPNFQKLYAYLIGCAVVQADEHGIMKWNTSLL